MFAPLSGEDFVFTNNTTAVNSAASCAEPKPTKAESVYQTLRQQILTSALPAGSSVSERVLAERLEVGKAPVRVAIQRLATEGFLTIEPRRGIRITEQSLQDVLDLFQVRILMEQLVVRKIAGRLRPPQVARLHENLREYQAAAAIWDRLPPEFSTANGHEDRRAPQQAAGVPDIDAMILADFSFHRLLAEFHGNRQLALMLDRTLDSLYREIRNTMTVRHRAEERLAEHQQIVDALVTGDAEAAERALVSHLRSGQRFVMSRGDTSVLSGG
jgi:DNA-binding GntR family transcriptional regulator